MVRSVLSPVSVLPETFERDGFAFPIVAVTKKQAAAYRACLEHEDKLVSARPAQEQELYRAYPHLLVPWVAELARNPQVLNAVSAVLGPNVLLWMASLFIKEPKTPDYVGWHQDLHYWGLSGTQEVTAWLAITPATVENGCMRFVALRCATSRLRCANLMPPRTMPC